jgi:hypothetical protein
VTIPGLDRRSILSAMSRPDQLLPVALHGTAMEVRHCRGLAAAEGTTIHTYAVISLPLTGARRKELGAYVASPDLAGDLTGVPPTPPKPRRSRPPGRCKS